MDFNFILYLKIQHYILIISDIKSIQCSRHNSCHGWLPWLPCLQDANVLRLYNMNVAKLHAYMDGINKRCHGRYKLCGLYDYQTLPHCYISMSEQAPIKK